MRRDINDYTKVNLLREEINNILNNHVFMRVSKPELDELSRSLMEVFEKYDLGDLLWHLEVDELCPTVITLKPRRMIDTLALAYLLI